MLLCLCLSACKVRVNEKDPLFIETQRCKYNQPRVIYTSDTAMTTAGRLQPLISMMPSIDGDMLANQFDQAALGKIFAESYQKLPQGRYDIVLELPPSMCLCPPDQQPTNWLGLLQNQVDEILTTQAINPAQTRWIYKVNPVITNPVLYFYVF